MAKITLTDITAGYDTTSVYAANNTLIENAVENTLSRDGTAPNQMEAALDMNSYRIQNLPTAVANSEPLTLGQAASLASISTAFTQENVGAVLYPQTSAENTASITPTNYYYPPNNVLRYGIVPDSTGARTANTTALKALLDPTTTGPVGRFEFPNVTGSSTYYFDGLVEIREGCHLDLMNCTIDFAKTYAAADQYYGFFTFIRDVSIENGSINVNYDGSSGTNAGMIMRIGARTTSYDWAGAAFEDEDNTDPMGRIRLSNLQLTTNNPGPQFAILMLGGLENVLCENIKIDGSDVVENGFYYEFGFYHYEATVANRTTSHARNMHFKNITCVDMEDSGTTGYVVNLVGAYNCTVDGIVANVSYGAYSQRLGEALFYNVGAPYVDDIGRINTIRNVTGKSITGILVNHEGAELASGGYLSGEGLSESDQVDQLAMDLSNFSVNGAVTGLVLDGPCTVRNGSIKGCSAEGLRITDECVDFSIDKVDILDGSTGGVRANFGGNIFATERKKVGSITNCFIAGNANNGIDIDHTESVLIANNRIGYNTAHDAAGETTQNIGVNVQSDGDGVVCEGNTIQISGGSNAYSITGSPRDCMIKNPKGIVTWSGAWGVDGVHQNETNTNIADVTHVVNTSNKYTGKLIRSSSTGVVLRATGPAAADTWVSIDLAQTTVSPV